jgi:hypothetical protein
MARKREKGDNVVHGTGRRLWRPLLLILPAALLWLVPSRPAFAQEPASLPDGAQSLIDSIYNYPQQGAPAGPAAVVKPAFNILDEIKRAQAFLKGRTAGYARQFSKRKVTIVDRRGRKKLRLRFAETVAPNFLLAVENLHERELRAVLITDKGCATDGFEVVRLRSNGVASRFQVRYPEEMAVLAIRTIVHGRYGGWEEVVYTPYSPEIDTPEVRRAGYDYLVDQIGLALADLERRQVRLRALGPLLYSDQLADVIFVLSIIEHMDPERFKSCTAEQEDALIREVLTVIGANAENAYAYSKSPAGARGLFQFMPATYERIRRKYPGAALVRDFVEGSTDHVNAAKASLLLFDSDLADLSRKLLLNVQDDMEAIGRVLAASYNCGPKRVQKSARECNDAWTCRLPAETRIYLEKFDRVWEKRKNLP